MTLEVSTRAIGLADPAPGCFVILYRPSGSAHRHGSYVGVGTLAAVDYSARSPLVVVFGAAAFPAPVRAISDEAIFERAFAGRNRRSSFQQNARAISGDELDAILSAATRPEVNWALAPTDVHSPYAGGLAEGEGDFDFDPPRRVSTIAVNVRLRAYRQRSYVRSAYAGCCLYTGRGSVVNGRYECEWSHWKSVADRGPDTIANTSLVSRTAHFYVEQGHLSLDETYAIIGSDIALDYVRRHNPRLQPWLPLDPADWPSQTYLAWHRARCRRSVPSWMP